MPVKTEKELGEGQRSHWLKAVAAVEMRNFGYAISLLQGVLKHEPEFLNGRQLLRRAEVAKLKAEKKGFFNLSTASVGVMKAQRELKKDPKRVVELVEKVLEDEPYHRQANLLLKEAAVAAGWPEIGVMALRTLLEEKPRDVKILHELGRLYRDLGESDKEVDVYNRICEADPTDSEALQMAKDAFRAGIDEDRRVDGGGELSGFDQGQGSRGFARAEEPDGLNGRVARAANRRYVCAAPSGTAECRSRAASRCPARAEG
jgi:cytochrome c-type biogenesis protein CcmH/NrfG